MLIYLRDPRADLGIIFAVDGRTVVVTILMKIIIIIIVIIIISLLSLLLS